MFDDEVYDETKKKNDFTGLLPNTCSLLTCEVDVEIGGAREQNELHSLEVSTLAGSDESVFGAVPLSSLRVATFFEVRLEVEPTRPRAAPF